jgi:hypothetical protein
MKKIIFILALALGFAWNCHAQTWTYIQDSLGTYCVNGASSCTLSAGNIIPTTAGSVWVIEIQTTTNVTILATHGWTLCPAGKCHLFSSSPLRNVDMAYQFAGAAGSTSVTVDLSGGSGTIFGANFFEFLPPAGSTASFDDANTTSSTSCTTACPGVALNIRGTDVILQSPHAANTSGWNAWSAPYTTLPLGEGLYLNATSGTAPTFATTGTGAVAHGIAFTSTAGSFTPPSNPISVLNFTSPQNAVCNPSCSLSLPFTVGAGHLLYMEAGDINSSFISSVSGGGSWVVPTGANTCRIALSGSNALSCAYVLSSSGGATSLNVTMTGGGSTLFAIWEVASTGGSFSFDAQGSATNGASYDTTGVALSLTGSHDVVFQSAFVPGGSSSVSYYPYPRIPGQGTMFFNNQAASAARINTTDGSAPHWVNQQNNATVVSGVAFKTGAGIALVPPTGLTAVVN